MVEIAIMQRENSTSAAVIAIRVFQLHRCIRLPEPFDDPPPCRNIKTGVDITIYLESVLPQADTLTASLIFGLAIRAGIC